MPTINTNVELATATRTNTPVINAPQEYQNKITEVAKKYLYNYMLRYSKDIIGIQEPLMIVRNRIENLLVEGLEKGTINTISNVNDLLRSNCMLEPSEEKAIIEAYHNGVPEAGIFIQIFFTFKIFDYMKTTHLIGLDNDQDVYCSLQAYLFELVKEFDFEKIAHGGLPRSFYNFKFRDYYRDQIVGKQSSLLSYNRRQAYDLSKARKITESDSRTKTLAQLSQEYGVPKSAIMNHFIISNPAYLDVERTRDDGETTSLLHESIEDTRNDFADDIERSECMKQMMSDLEQLNIKRSTTTAVLAAIISYTYSATGTTKQGRIKKMSQPVYREIADSLQVPVRTVNEVVNKFVETFAS